MRLLVDLRRFFLIASAGVAVAVTVMLCDRRARAYVHVKARAVTCEMVHGSWGLTPTSMRDYWRRGAVRCRAEERIRVSRAVAVEL